MKTRFVFMTLALMILSLLLGCSGRENSVTGLYPTSGTRLLTGQIVTVGDLAGSSPAGINVSTSGQVAVTDTNGHFTFTALAAQDTQLNFSRLAEGINARGMVSGSASAVVVQLQKSQATITVTSSTRDGGETGVLTCHGVPIPAGQLPPPGQCKIWNPALPAGQQGPPGDCDTLRSNLGPGLCLLDHHGVVEQRDNDGGETGVLTCHGVEIPAGQLPPPGQCKIWNPALPAGQQGPPGDCDTLRSNLRPGLCLLDHHGVVEQR